MQVRLPHFLVESSVRFIRPCPRSVAEGDDRTCRRLCSSRSLRGSCRRAARSSGTRAPRPRYISWGSARQTHLRHSLVMFAHVELDERSKAGTRGWCMASPKRTLGSHEGAVQLARPRSVRELDGPSAGAVAGIARRWSRASRARRRPRLVQDERATARCHPIAPLGAATLQVPPPSLDLSVMDVAEWNEVAGTETFGALSVFCVGSTTGGLAAAVALRAGAVEYVLRGCDPEELWARLDRAVARRPDYGQLDRNVVLRLHPERRTAEIAGTEVRLRPAEVAVLSEVVKPGWHSPKDLVKTALRSNGNGQSAINQVYEIQRKFRRAGLQKPIRSVRGAG